MVASTRRMQETLIRLLKGCLKAWEMWLREQPIDAPEQSTNSQDT